MRQHILFRQGEGDRHVAAPEGVGPAVEVVYAAQTGVAPGVGAVEQDDLVTLVEHDIPRLGSGLAVAGG